MSYLICRILENDMRPNVVSYTEKNHRLGKDRIAITIAEHIKNIT